MNLDKQNEKVCKYNVTIFISHFQQITSTLHITKITSAVILTISYRRKEFLFSYFYINVFKHLQCLF